MNDTDSYRTPIISTLPAADYSAPECRERCRFRYQQKITRLLQSLGFEHVLAIRTPQGAGHEPDFLAIRHNRRCCIYLPEVASSVMRINHLSAKQCQHCEQHHEQDDAYYAALYVANSSELKMLLPYRIRRGGTWIASEAAEQFLPFSLRKHINSFAPLLGGAHVFKLVCVVLPFLMNMGSKARFRITGTSPGNDYCEPPPPYTVQLVETAHSIFNLLHAEPGNAPRLVRPCFYHEGIAHCELELLSTAKSGHTSTVQLLARNGAVLRADCLETLVVPELIPANRRYHWSLSLVAESCHPGTPTTPPHTVQAESSPYTRICGRIHKLHELKVCERPIPVAELQFQHDSPGEHLCVYLAPEVTEGYTPQVGDTICCTGILRAAPRNLAEGHSWQDSPEVANRQYKREQETQALLTYMRHAAHQPLQAAAAAAFVQAGWQLTAFPAPGEQTAHLLLSNQRGEQISLAVHPADTPIPATGADYCCGVRIIPHPECCKDHFLLEIKPPCPGIPSSIELPSPLTRK